MCPCSIGDQPQEQSWRPLCPAQSPKRNLNSSFSPPCLVDLSVHWRMKRSLPPPDVQWHSAHDQPLKYSHSRGTTIPSPLSLETHHLDWCLVVGIPKGGASPSVVVSQMAEEREEAIFPALLTPALFAAGCCLCHEAPGSAS